MKIMDKVNPRNKMHSRGVPALQLFAKQIVTSGYLSDAYFASLSPWHLSSSQTLFGMFNLTIYSETYVSFLFEQAVGSIKIRLSLNRSEEVSEES
jgi:hypothetical protein